MRRESTTLPSERVGGLEERRVGGHGDSFDRSAADVASDRSTSSRRRCDLDFARRLLEARQLGG